MNLGKRLQEVRKHYNLTVDQLAEKAGVKPRTLGSYERNEAKAPIELLEFMQQSFHVDLNWLVTGKGEMFLSPDQQAQSINGNNNVQLNNASIHITHNQKEIEEIVNILKDLPERSIKKLYHLAELERLENK